MTMYIKKEAGRDWPNQSAVQRYRCIISWHRYRVYTPWTSRKGIIQKSVEVL